MGGVADAEQAGGRPLLKAIDLDGEKFDLVPGVDLGGASGEEGNDALNALLKGRDAGLLDLGEGAFGDDVADLKVVVAIDEDDEAAVVDVAEGILGIGWLARDFEPEDVYGNAFVVEREVASIAGDGVAAVAADGYGGGDFDGAVWSVGPNASGDSVLVDEAGGLPAHAEVEGRVARGFGGEEVEEVPLRHEGYELAVGGDVREVRDGEAFAAYDGGKGRDLRVRDGEELLQEA